VASKAAVLASSVLGGLPEQTVAVTGGTASEVSVWSHYVAYGTGQPRMGPSHVEVRDLTAGGRLLLLVSSEFAGGDVDWSRGDGTTLTYLDTYTPPDPQHLVPGPGVDRWAIGVIDIDTGARRVLARGGPLGGGIVELPLPLISHGEVLWHQVDPGRHRNAINEVAVAGGPVRTLLSAGGLESVSVAGDRIVYDLATSSHGDATLWQLPLHGGVPQPIASSGRAAWPDASTDGVVWQETSPHAQTGPDRIGYAPYAGGAWRYLARGVSQGNVAAGSDFVAWWTSSDGVKVHRLSDGATFTLHPTTGNLDVGSRMSATGTRLVWGSADVNLTTGIIHIVTVPGA